MVWRRHDFVTLVSRKSTLLSHEIHKSQEDFREDFPESRFFMCHARDRRAALLERGCGVSPQAIAEASPSENPIESS